jgi:hypothetical protein
MTKPMARLSKILLPLTLSIALAQGASSQACSAAALPPLQLGFDTTFQDPLCHQSFNVEAPYIRSAALTQFQSFKSLGANSVGIDFPIYINSSSSNDPRPRCQSAPFDAESPSPQAVRLVVKIAHGLGLGVLLRPLISERNFESSGAWRGVITPTHPSKWLWAYYSSLLPYVAIARTQHVEHLAISTELESLSNNPEWNSLVASLHSNYQGDLVFTHNWQSYMTSIVQPDTSFAVDNYVSLDGSSPSSSVSQLLSTFESVAPILPVSADHVVIDETGIPALDGAYLTPYEWWSPTQSFDPLIQANYMRLNCRIVKHFGLSGVYFFGSILEERGGALLQAPSWQGADQLQPDTQSVIRACFQSLGS